LTEQEQQALEQMRQAQEQGSTLKELAAAAGIGVGTAGGIASEGAAALDAGEAVGAAAAEGGVAGAAGAATAAVVSRGLSSLLHAVGCQ